MDKLLLANKRLHEFSIEGEVQGIEVKGDFKAKYPSVLDNIEIQNRHSNIVKGSNLATLADVAYDSAYVMAYLEVTLIEKPDWFNFEIIDNFEIIYKVFDEVRLFVDDFRKGNDGKKDSGNSAKSKSKEVVESE